ncbi:39S ribosomal protein L10, mitochondrial, partial [Ophiophagus hannah]
MNPPVILPKEETGYERLLWRQGKQIFLDNKMIIVCQYNYIPGNGNIEESAAKNLNTRISSLSLWNTTFYLSGESAGFFSVMTSHTSRLLQRGSVHLCSLLVLYVQQENEKVEEKLDRNNSYTGSSFNSS